MKKIIILILPMVFQACGGNNENNAEVPKAVNKDLIIEGNIVGMGEYWYDEKGRNVSRVSLKIETDDNFIGDILFNKNGDDPLAKGILITDRERTNFKKDALFKKVKLTLKSASNQNLKNAYFIAKLEYIKNNPHNQLAIGEVIIDSTSELKWMPVGDELHSNTKECAVINSCAYKDNLYAFSGVNTEAVGISLGYLGADYLKGIEKLENRTWKSEGLNLRGVIYSSIIYHDELYVGGKFNAIGDVKAYGIAKFNNFVWSNIGNKSPLGEDAKILSFAEYKGDLYVGGDFGYAFGENVANGIAKWDGNKWSSLGIGKITDYKNNIMNGLPGLVRALVVYKDELYAGGTFTTADGKYVHGIARWNGKEWLPVGLGVDGPVLSLAVFKNELYIGGKFKSVGGSPAKSIAKWDGKDWTIISNSSFDDGAIRSMLVLDDMLYISGDFLFRNKIYTKNIAKFDGRDFYSVGQQDDESYGITGQINGLTSYRNELYIVGDFTIVSDENIIKGITKLSDKK